MPHPCPHHCPPERGSGLAIVVAIVVLAVAAAAVRSAMPAIEHTAELAIEVLVITVASVIGLAAIGASAYVALRVRRSQATRRQALSGHSPVTLQAVRSRSARRAIEAPRPPLYVVDTEHRIKEEK